MALCVGCGTTKSFTATEQILVSNAIDSTVSKVDFRPLSGRKVFLDQAYIPSQKGTGNPNPQLVHSEYLVSSLRQQMLAAGVLLCEKREESDLILEVRLGALGFDAHSITYGLPASSSMSTAASSLSGSPFIPLIPELSVAKKEAKQGATKIAMFAYERTTLEPVWQSGIARSSSSARDTWVLGVGPLQQGSIYDETRFAGSRMRGPIKKLAPHEDDDPEQLVEYSKAQVYSTSQADLPKPPDSVNVSIADDGSSITQATATAPTKP